MAAKSKVTEATSKFSYTPLLTGLLVLSVFINGILLTMMFMQGGNFFNTTPKATTINDALISYAKDLKLDRKKFEQCLTSNKYRKTVDSDLAYGQQLGIQGTPAFYINGRLIGGAFPYEAFKELIDNELSGTASANIEDYSEVFKGAFENGSFNPQPITLDLGNAPIKGDQNAKVTIVEFSDFQCPYCARAHPTVKQVLNDYQGKVKLAYKHYPLTSIHPLAIITAEASECAREQGKFWEYHDVLFEKQQDWTKLPGVTPKAS